MGVFRKPRWAKERSNHGWKWSRKEDDFVKAHAGNQQLKWIAEKLGRTVSAVKHHCYLLNISPATIRIRLTIADAERMYPDLIKGQIWRGTHRKYWFICKTHGRYEQVFSDHKHHRCQKCGIEKSHEAQLLTIVQEAEKRFPDMVKGQEQQGVLHKQRGVRHKYQFNCETHGEYSQTLNKHNHGRGCPECSESHGEQAVAAYFEEIHEPFERQKRFDTCRNKNPLPFDFFLPNRQVLVEFNGEQHYRSVTRFGGVTKFKNTKHHDHIKKLWARRNGYRLIVIPHTVKNIPGYLEKRIQQSSESQAVLSMAA